MRVSVREIKLIFRRIVEDNTSMNALYPVSSGCIPALKPRCKICLMLYRSSGTGLMEKEVK